MLEEIEKAQYSMQAVTAGAEASFVSCCFLPDRYGRGSGHLWGAVLDAGAAASSADAAAGDAGGGEDEEHGDRQPEGDGCRWEGGCLEDRIGTAQEVLGRSKQEDKRLGKEKAAVEAVVKAGALG